MLPSVEVIAGVHLVWVALCSLPNHMRNRRAHIKIHLYLHLSLNSVGEKNTRTCVNIFYWVFFFTRRSRWLSSWLKQTMLEAEKRHNDIIYHSRTHTRTHSHWNKGKRFWALGSSFAFPFAFLCPIPNPIPMCRRG